jgi:sterol desaturase/sphingolipid hydroxylase (fatty acid hydroxylase superfamily)
MKNFKINNKGSARLFSNKILERLTRTHFLIPVTLYYLCSLAMIAYAFYITGSTWLSLLIFFPVGFIFFTLIEYLIHRFIFHFNVKNEREMELQYNIHGVHHEFPRDKDRLVMPPVLSIVIAFLFFVLFTFLLGSSGYLLFAGFSAGYSTYLLIHYFIHARKAPRNFLKYLWVHHSLHHYSSIETAFAVSMPFWDYLFGTMPVRPSGQQGESVGEKKPATH